MDDRRLTQGSQSGRSGRVASLAILALLILFIVASSASAATPKLAIARALKGTEPLNLPYDVQLYASGGTGPYKYWISSGSLPPGAALGSNGELTGAPSEAGTFRVTVTARDSEGLTGSRNFTLKVALGFYVSPESPTPSMYVGGGSAVEAGAVGGSGQYTYSAKAKKLPPGTTLVEQNGQAYILGTPTQAGDYSVPVTATDLVTRAKVTFDVPVRVFGSVLPVILVWAEEPGQPRYHVWFNPEEEKDGVISGTTFGGAAQFTYNLQTERLHIVSGEGGPSAEYWSICEPAALSCTGTGPHGTTTFTD